MGSAHQAKSAFESATKQLQSAAPEPNDALQWLRQNAQTYAAFVPGAKGYVDAAFNDLDAIRSKQGDKVDGIVKEAYNELKDVTQQGMSLEVAQKAWAILQKHLKAIGDLAGDATSDILNNHPAIKEQVGGNLDRLKEMGDMYGPEAKNQVDQTWTQIQDIIKGGISIDTASKIRSVVQEKMDLVKKMGDDAWTKGMEQAKPYLEKFPKVKEMIEKNADSLKQGNATELLAKVKDTIQSGNTDSLESYVKSAVDNAKSKGGHLEAVMKGFPGADEIKLTVEELRKLADMGGESGEEAFKIAAEALAQVEQIIENLLQTALSFQRETYDTNDEILQILHKGVQQLRGLADNTIDNAER